MSNLNKMKISCNRFHLLLFLVLSLSSGLFFTTSAYAQISSLGIATYLPIEETRVEDGDIITLKNQGYFLTNKPYASGMIGIVSTNPSVVIRTDAENSFPVVNSGTTLVKITGENGNIQAGDFITSSSTPGSGMKAITNGYIIGRAAEDTIFKTKNEIKLVPIIIDIRFINNDESFMGSLTNMFNFGELDFTNRLTKILQLIIAGIILIISFVLGFRNFSKMMESGITALALHPQSGNQIKFAIISNIIVIMLIIIIGATISFMIISI